MNKVTIEKLHEDDIDRVVDIIRQSNQLVADQFGITAENNPKHPSFYTNDWLLNDLSRGEEFFVYKHNGMPVACVAFENPRPDAAYLNRLSVLPIHQLQGIGKALVEYIAAYAQEKKIRSISIGIIAEHVVLKNWYIKLGFKEGATKTLPHLPFDVTYLRLALIGE
jgi:GNAT superfamily N-acetyltransferase